MVLRPQTVVFSIGLSVAAALVSARPAAAQSLIYSDSSTQEKLQSRVGVGLEGDLSLEADVTMIGEDGVTRVLPRVTSEWNGLDFLDIDTVLSYQDLNAAGVSPRPTLDTKVAFKTGLGFIERVEGSVKRADVASTETLKVDFAGIDTDFALLGGDPFGVEAGVVVRNADGAGRQSSSITSSWGVGRALDFKSVVSFDRDAGGGSAAPALNTSFVYDAPIAVIDQLEGAVQRSPDGVRQSLGLRFTEYSSGDPYGSAFKISSRAIVEEMLQPDGVEKLKMGVETKLTNVLPPLLGGSSALSFRVDRDVGQVDSRTSTLTYDHSWSPGDDASIGLNLKLLRGFDDEVEPSMGVTWSARF